MVEAETTAIAVAVPESMPEPVAGEYEAGIAEDDAEAETLTPETPPDEPDPDDEVEPEPDDEGVEPEPELPAEPPEPPGPFHGLEAQVDVKALKAFLAQVLGVADEARVIADIDGWHVKVVDPAHVEMIDVLLPYKAFDLNRTYWAANAPQDGPAKPESVVFGIDVEKLAKKLKSLKAGQIRFVYEDDDKSGHIMLGLGNREDSVGAVDTAGMSDPKIPGLTMPVEFRVPAKLLADVVKSAGEISDHIWLTVEPDSEGQMRLITEAQGDIDKTRNVFQTEVEWVRSDGASHRSGFPLDYLDSFLKVVKGETLTVQMGSDYPLRVDWGENLEGKATGATKGTYLCAPRIESDG